MLKADGSVRQLTDLQGGAQDPTWSPDGRQITFNTRHGDHGSGIWTGIWVASVPDGALTQLTQKKNSNPDYDPAWSPDGEWIAFIRHKTNYSSGYGDR